ncbi:hypothetical protein DTL42_18290 [Bremerella cremea]|uniref:Uncharacterized protein n=1 Tax=Bremerella cremea TaxID=1031537 RepID=A0A368KPU7_9BACT|nr:hypothetical protein [Bremerella cremea]RCS43936.1 hypothetical protein DTL42_18290 [Bremerella cremea]
MHDSLYFIDDGYTQSGHIQASAGLHGAVSFQFRPMLYEQRQRIAEMLRAAANDEATQVMVAAICQQVLSWNLPRELKPANVRRLRPKLLDRIYLIVAGHEPSDPLPSGQPLETFDELADAKN